jgi:ATP-dependent RNA helicase DDX55/SPB4
MAAFEDRGGHVLVGTPGRLMDMFERCGVLVAKRLEVLVLDEADRLLDAGYGKHLEVLMRRLPKQRRTGALPGPLPLGTAA